MSKKLTFDHVKKEIKKLYPKYQMLSPEYINSKEKLHMICENNHEFKMPYSDIKNHWCLECYNLKRSDTIRLSYDEVKTFIESKHPGAKLLSEKYKNNFTKLDIICENKHYFQMTYYNIKGRHWCSYCNGNTKLTLNDVTDFINIKHPNSKILNKYKNARTKLDIVCKNNHNFKMTFDDIKNNGRWCPYCNELKGEKSCRRLLEIIFKQRFIKLNPKWLINPNTNRTLELDGYCEKLNIAFEYDGFQHYEFPNYFHKTEKQFIEQKERDFIKNKLCKDNGVLLIRIKEFENLNQDVVIKNILEELYKYPELLNLIEPFFLQQ
jgi:hypothetical protein